MRTSLRAEKDGAPDIGALPSRIPLWQVGRIPAK